MNNADSSLMSNQTFPAEWAPQQAVLLAWPNANTDWAHMLPEVQQCYVNIVHAIVEYARVVIIADDVESVYGAMSDIDSSRLLVVEMEYNDTWTRDYGVITTISEDGTFVLNDFCFNGWGMKFAADRDNLVTRKLHFNGLLAGRYVNRLGFIFEGGSIESDGKGTLLTTAQCLLSPNRNGGMTRRGISQYLKSAFGATKILWLKSGHLAGDDTDSHIDTLARFAPNDTILYVGCDNPDDEHYRPLLSMRSELSSFRTAQGLPYNLLELPLPDPCYDDDGNRLPATYANFLIINNAIIMPTYNSPKKDKLACMIVKIAFPGHTVVPVDCRALIQQHGSLHCATMQLPCFGM